MYVFVLSVLGYGDWMTVELCRNLSAYPRTFLAPDILHLLPRQLVTMGAMHNGQKIATRRTFILEHKLSNFVDIFSVYDRVLTIFTFK